MDGQPYVWQLTYEQNAQLDELCEEHGTLRLDLWRHRPGGLVLYAYAEDGTAWSLDEVGNIKAMTRGVWSG